jgi:NADPH:quinone reductase-like Zn-dependent oxidoreductase
VGEWEALVATMMAAVLRAHGGPEVLELRDDVLVPRPAAGQVRVEVAAAAVNNTDLWTREGAYGTPDDADAVVGWQGVPIAFPRIQGGDAVGRVVELGDGAPDALLGRRVLVDPITYGQGGDPDERPIEGVLGSEMDGAFAEYVCVPAAQVHDVTDSPLSDEQLACLPIAYGTATGMLERAAVTAGERVLVTGASGGVGIALVQLAAARGAQVVAVTNGRTADAVRRAGASHIVLRDEAPLQDQLAGVGPFAVVADVVGGPSFGALLGALGTGGRLVTCGAVAGPVVEIDLRVLYLQRRALIGSTMHTASQFRRLVEDARAGRLSPPVACTYPLAEIHRAQEEFASGGHVGKLVLTPRA